MAPFEIGQKMKHSDAPFYEKAASELTTKTADRGLLAKAFSISMGDESKTKALYIQFRVEQLKSQATEHAVTETENISAEKRRAAAEDKARKEAQRVSPAVAPPKPSNMRFP